MEFWAFAMDRKWMSVCAMQQHRSKSGASPPATSLMLSEFGPNAHHVKEAPLVDSRIGQFFVIQSQYHGQKYHLSQMS